MKKFLAFSNSRREGIPFYLGDYSTENFFWKKKIYFYLAVLIQTASHCG